MGSKASLKEVPRPSRALCCHSYIAVITQAVQFKVSNPVPTSSRPTCNCCKGRHSDYSEHTGLPQGVIFTGSTEKHSSVPPFLPTQLPKQQAFPYKRPTEFLKMVCMHK